MKNEDAASYRSYYEHFLKNERLIQETATNYYHIVTETMDKQKSKLSVAQALTYLMIIDNSFLDSIYLKAVLSYDFKAPAKSIGEYSFDQTGRI